MRRQGQCQFLMGKPCQRQGTEVKGLCTFVRLAKDGQLLAGIPVATAVAEAATKDTALAANMTRRAVGTMRANYPESTYTVALPEAKHPTCLGFQIMILLSKSLKKVSKCGVWVGRPQNPEALNPIPSTISLNPKPSTSSHLLSKSHGSPGRCLRLSFVAFWVQDLGARFKEFRI